MLGQLVIDPAQFVRDRGHSDGSLTAAQLPRLADQLCDGEGVVRYEVDGFFTRNAHPALRVKLGGSLGLRCQRCLGTLAYDIAAERDIVLIQGTLEFVQGDDEDDSTDTIPV